MKPSTPSTVKKESPASKDGTKKPVDDRKLSAPPAKQIPNAPQFSPTTPQQFYQPLPNTPPPGNVRNFSNFTPAPAMGGGQQFYNNAPGSFNEGFLPQQSFGSNLHPDLIPTRDADKVQIPLLDRAKLASIIPRRYKVH